MDDVIERMEKVMEKRGRPLAHSDIVAALRAVADTHRLVPVEPTEEMLHEWSRVSGVAAPFLIEWEAVIGAAPDYTGSDDA